MNKPINIIFSNLSLLNDNVHGINKFLKKQKNINEQLLVSVLALSIYVCVNEYNKYLLTQKIDRLDQKIEELDVMKGK